MLIHLLLFITEIPIILTEMKWTWKSKKGNTLIISHLKFIHEVYLDSGGHCMASSSRFCLSLEHTYWLIDF